MATDDKPKITVIYQEPPKPITCTRVLLELVAVVGAGLLIALFFGR